MQGYLSVCRNTEQRSGKDTGIPQACADGVDGGFSRAVHVPSAPKQLGKSLLDLNSRSPPSPMKNDLHFRDEELMQDENVCWGGSQALLTYFCCGMGTKSLSESQAPVWCFGGQ